MNDCTSLWPEMNPANNFATTAAEPLFVAAAAWEDLAADLGASASSFGEVISMALGSEAWSEPSSAPVSAALRGTAEAYLDWLKIAASQAKQSALDARTAATIVGPSTTGSLSPTAMAANRKMRASLIENNFFGQNAATIGCLEAAYAEMWTTELSARLNNETRDPSARSMSKRACGFTAELSSPSGDLDRLAAEER